MGGLDYEAFYTHMHTHTHTRTHCFALIWLSSVLIQPRLTGFSAEEKPGVAFDFHKVIIS